MTAYIHIWGQRVGAVAWDPDSRTTSFEYEPNFDLDQYPLAPLTMPQKGSIYSFPELKDSETFKGLPGLLADALPDRYGKDMINVWLAQQGRPANSLNPVELLCFVGKRAMGALEFEPALKDSEQGKVWELESLVDITRQLLASKEEQLLTQAKDIKDVVFDVLKMGTSAGGARPKAIIAYNEKTGQIRSGQVSTDEDFEHWLIKFDGVNATQFGTSHGYGRVEMAYYKMATDFGIKMMESRLIEENNRAHFMTKRFDRKEGNQKIHTQTFCAIRHFDYAHIYSYSYEQLFQTLRMLSLTYAEAEQMFRRMVFNLLANNCDDHTKNFSFMMEKDRTWQLAPAYDICYAYSSNNEWVKQHILSLNGKRKDFVMADFLKLAKQNSIKNPKKIVEKALEIVNHWSEYAKEYYVERDLMEAINKTLIKRIANAD